MINNSLNQSNHNTTTAKQKRKQKSPKQIHWTVPQMSIIIIYNSTWSILIQYIRIKLKGDNLT